MAKLSAGNIFPDYTVTTQFEDGTTISRIAGGKPLMLVVLTGVLSCGETAPELAGGNEGHACHFFLAFDPSLFGDPAGIREWYSRTDFSLQWQRPPGCPYQPHLQGFMAQTSMNRLG